MSDSKEKDRRPRRSRQGQSSGGNIASSIAGWQFQGTDPAGVNLLEQVRENLRAREESESEEQENRAPFKVQPPEMVECTMDDCDKEGPFLFRKASTPRTDKIALFLHKDESDLTADDILTVATCRRCGRRSKNTSPIVTVWRIVVGCIGDEEGFRPRRGKDSQVKTRKPSRAEQIRQQKLEEGGKECGQKGCQFVLMPDQVRFPSDLGELASVAGVEVGELGCDHVFDLIRCKKHFKPTWGMDFRSKSVTDYQSTKDGILAARELVEIEAQEELAECEQQAKAKEARLAKKKELREARLASKASAPKKADADAHRKTKGRRASTKKRSSRPRSSGGDKGGGSRHSSGKAHQAPSLSSSQRSDDERQPRIWITKASQPVVTKISGLSKIAMEISSMSLDTDDLSQESADALAWAKMFVLAEKFGSSTKKLHPPQMVVEMLTVN